MNQNDDEEENIAVLHVALQGSCFELLVIALPSF